MLENKVWNEYAGKANLACTQSITTPCRHGQQYIHASGGKVIDVVPRKGCSLFPRGSMGRSFELNYTTPSRPISCKLCLFLLRNSIKDKIAATHGR